MHARVSVFQMTPDELDAGVEYERGTIAEMMEMEGFRGNLALVDRKTRRITPITLWESEDAMTASEERANAMRSSGAAANDGSVVSGWVSGPQRHCRRPSSWACSPCSVRGRQVTLPAPAQRCRRRSASSRQSPSRTSTLRVANSAFSRRCRMRRPNP